MILSTHALVGATLGKEIDNAWILIPLSIVVHFFLDSFRHGEYLDRNSKFKKVWWKATIDVILALCVITLFIYINRFNVLKIKTIILGVFFSLFPDFLTLLYWELNFKFLERISRFHNWIHKYPPFAKEREWNLRNGLNDILISAVSIAILFI